MSVVLEARKPSAKYLSAVQPKLVQHFELLGKAPGGLARLRSLILTLAVRGKLVPQDPRDEPASDLLKQVRVEMARLIAEGKIKREKPQAEISEEEQPFELPSGWTWVRLAEIAYPQAGFAFKSSGFNQARQGLPLIRIRDVGGNDPATYFAGDHREEFVVESGDWLISMDGEFRVREWKGPKALLNQRVTRLVFFGQTLFQPFVIASLQFKLSELQGTKAYTTVDHLSGGQIASSVVALPPLSEQARIVTRVEELMRLCDALEAKSHLEAVQHAQLVQTLFGALTASATPDELADSWQRVAAHFDLLLDRPEAIDALEHTILQLAVRGLLSPQDLNDEPAENFVRRINVDREIRRVQDSREVLASTEEGQLPKGWCVTNIGCISECLDYIRRPIKKSDREATVGTVPYFGANGQVGWIDDYLFDEDLVLVVEDETFIGRTKPFSYIVRGKSWVNNHAHVLRPLGGMTVEYLNLCLERYDFIPLTSGTTNRRKLTKAGLLDASVLIAPLPEQSRIVARVEALRRLCADLRQRLAARQTTQFHLVEALIDEVA